MQNQLKILMIDNDKHFLDIYKSRLEREGFRVFTAENGEKGLKVATKEKPDLITLDIVMPVKDGLETLEALKTSLESKAIPVIMLSTSSSVDYIKKALDDGAVQYLIKGHTNPGELVRKIHDIISK